MANRRRESHQREALNRFLHAKFKSRLIYFSDVDEFLDPASVRRLPLVSTLASHTCASPLLRPFYYGAQCPVNETW